MTTHRIPFVSCFLCLFVLACGDLSPCSAQDKDAWKYAPEELQPFWNSKIMLREPVLFVHDSESKEARGTMLYPIEKVIAVHNSAGDVTYEEGRDYRFVPRTREITIPVGSRIVTKSPEDLRRPAGSQKYALTHRDGNGEILFGAKLEYHDMQTCVTYQKATDDWDVAMPSFDPALLPVTIAKLRQGEPVSIVLLGDSISTGCNASGWAKGPPHQPAYPELVRLHLQNQYNSDVELTNLSVGGTSTPWGISMIDEVVRNKPDLVMLAFGMNDSAGRSAEEYGKNTAIMIEKTREALPEAEFILIASMLGNRNWTRLNHDAFASYRDQLKLLSQPKIAIADLTSVWDGFLERKQDWDLTGNGVNHPNDFGHRVYAQVILSRLTEPSTR
ncbi:MAG: SGNH/GDSL hydrolase family protein [Pirellulaceae bacterium]